MCCIQPCLIDLNAWIIHHWLLIEQPVNAEYNDGGESSGQSGSDGSGNVRDQYTWAPWHVSTTLRRLKLEDCHVLEASLDHIAISRPVWSIQ